VEEEGPHALEVGPKADAAEDAQDQTAEDLVIIILYIAKLLRLDISSNTGLKLVCFWKKNFRENLERQNPRRSVVEKVQDIRPHHDCAGGH
jgi:hypothetical protein